MFKGKKEKKRIIVSAETLANSAVCSTLNKERWNKLLEKNSLLDSGYGTYMKNKKKNVLNNNFANAIVSTKETSSSY